MKLFSKIIGLVTISGMLMLGVTSCKKQQYQILTTSDVNIVDYLRRYPDQFSEYVKVLDRTNISPFLNAYGAYTCFAPTNDAFKQYLKDAGKSSTDDIDTATLKNILKYHLINDTIRTTAFTDGKLYAPTMQGQYLTTSVNTSGTTIINRLAALTQANVVTGNGYIHVVNRVLLPSSLTVAKTVESNSRYSIFTQALKATGWYDSLNIANNPDTTRRWRTLIAQSDSVYNAIGITSYAALKAKYNNTGNPLNPADSLNIYVAYHILPGVKYVADIVAFQSHVTMVDAQVITVTLDGQSVLLNQATFNGVFEAGVPMSRYYSDVSCNNGVVNEVSGNILAKKRDPFRVDFDIAAQPEIIKLPSLYHSKTAKSQTFAYGQLSEVTWQNTSSTPAYSSEGATSSNFYWWDDHFDWNMRFGNPAANNWIEFKTPLIVKGTYKVWVMCRASSNGQYVQASVDGVPLSRLLNFVTRFDASLSGSTLEAVGYKRYAADQPTTTTNNWGMLAGAVTINSTDRHTIRFTCVKDQGSTANNLTTVDFVQFIPIDFDQQRPLYKRDGTIVP
ncbi:MAG: hypothetical protein C0459_01540 [Chitinophaga sp.]|jgi:uncharacterized surface protein with fasciclin (FAS1) repeats|nr:hypothetical protein [Chitinophaga sp.]